MPGPAVPGPAARPRSGLAGELDHHGLAAVPRRVVDPDLEFGSMLPGGAAAQVERIGNTVRPGDALIRAGEGVGFLHPAGAIDAHEAESLGVIAGVSVMDVEVDPYALLVCPGARYLRHQRCRW